MLCVGQNLSVAIADDTPGAAGDMAPDSGPFAYDWDNSPVLKPGETDLTSAAGAIRILTWNVLWSNIIEAGTKDYFRRILQAVQPDIINLQEILEHDETAALIEEWLPLEQGSWHYLGFSDRVTISRFPIVWDWPPTYEPLHGRYTLVPVEVTQGERLLVFNAHLSFGSYGEERQLEADSFIAFLREMMTPGGAVAVQEGTPFVLLGDLNLVGDAQQLRTLLTGQIVNTGQYGQPHAPDWDGSHLADLFPLHTGSRMGFTWQVDEGGFWPGKLDYFIYSDSVMEVVDSFVVNTATMSKTQLATYGLEKDDCRMASDHLPVVVDVEL